MLFSQRQGFKPVSTAIQLDSMDAPLRNSLWNALQVVVWDSHVDGGHHSYTVNSNLRHIFKKYWSEYFKMPTDQIPMYVRETISALRGYFFECQWYEVYDFVEFTASCLSKSRPLLILEVNQVLVREVSGFRFLGDKIVPISSATELEAITAAIAQNSGSPGARLHFQRALDLLSDRKAPDYRNSIKESISAVESVVVEITGDSTETLGSALKIIAAGSRMHPALVKSLTSLYGYTSDSDGIRHAMLEEPDLDFVDAKFMLVACTAFANYLRAKAAVVRGS